MYKEGALLLVKLKVQWRQLRSKCDRAIREGRGWETHAEGAGDLQEGKVLRTHLQSNILYLLHRCARVQNCKHTHATVI